MPSSAGLVDLQVNGFAGVDFNSGTISAEALDHALEAMLATGVTMCLPTIITAYPAALEQRLRALDAAVNASKLGPLMCPGYHLEGPFLNPEPGYRGCHPPGAMTPADGALIARLQAVISRPILMITVAPEIPGVMDLIPRLVDQGMIVAIGHTAASIDVVAAAAAAGARMSTHLGNGVPQLTHKFANPIFAQLAEDRLSAGFIADGVHLPVSALKPMMRAKGFERSILVTDAATGAASAPGRYRFAGMEIDRMADGSLRLAEHGSLAGSALCLDQAVRNVVAWNLAPPAQAIAMASDNPRALLEPALARTGPPLERGIVEWTEHLTVQEVRIGAVERHFAARQGGHAAEPGRAKPA